MKRTRRQRQWARATAKVETLQWPRSIHAVALVHQPFETPNARMTRYDITRDYDKFSEFRCYECTWMGGWPMFRAFTINEARDLVAPVCLSVSGGVRCEETTPALERKKRELAQRIREMLGVEPDVRRDEVSAVEYALTWQWVDSSCAAGGVRCE
jgi:hypothetical protein